MFVVTALVFAGSHWITEAFTAIQLELVRPIVVPAPSNPAAMDRLRLHVLADLIIEAKIALCAAIFLFAGQLLIHFMWRRPLRRWAPLFARLVGVVFCWTRWAIDLTLRANGIHYSETADWIIAMALAFVASFLLFRWVQKI